MYRNVFSGYHRALDVFFRIRCVGKVLVVCHEVVQHLSCKTVFEACLRLIKNTAGYVCDRGRESSGRLIRIYAYAHNNIFEFSRLYTVRCLR